MDGATDFIRMVHREFGPLAERHGMRERQRSDTMAFRSVLFAGGGTFVRFSLDVRDADLSAEYGDASNLDVYGNVDPSLPPRAWVGGVGELLREEGLDLPSGPDELSLPGRLVEAVRTIVAVLSRHENAVFRSRP